MHIISNTNGHTYSWIDHNGKKLYLKPGNFHCTVNRKPALCVIVKEVDVINGTEHEVNKPLFVNENMIFIKEPNFIEIKESLLIGI